MSPRLTDSGMLTRCTICDRRTFPIHVLTVGPICRDCYDRLAAGPTDKEKQDG